MTNDTLNYYEENASSFTSSTLTVDFSATQNRFLKELPFPSHILDFGCGSGRDTKYFLDKGYSVEAIDGSAQLCRLASEYTGIQVKQMYFQDLSEVEKYDGIWACSSILHVSKAELPDVLVRMRDALKTGGTIYTSFKYGDFEGMRNGRYFSNFTEEILADLLKNVPGLVITDQWITGDVRPGRESEQWLNLLLRKE